jgi:hypothetical protein
MELARIWNAPKVDFQSAQAFHYFVDVALEGVCDDIESAAAIGRAQRFGQSRGAGGNNSVCCSTLGALDYFGEKRGCNLRHIAGYDQIPILVRSGKSGVNTGEWAARRIYISDNRITKVTISGRVADQSHVTHGLMYLRGNVFQQRDSFEWEQRFVGTHTGTLAARQHESRAFHAGNDNIIGTHKA